MVSEKISKVFPIISLSMGAINHDNQFQSNQSKTLTGDKNSTHPLVFTSGF